MVLWDVEQENDTLRQKRRVCTGLRPRRPHFSRHSYLPGPQLERHVLHFPKTGTRSAHYLQHRSNPGTPSENYSLHFCDPDTQFSRFCDTCPTTGFNRNAIRRTFAILAPNPNAIRRTLAILAPNRDAICYTFVCSERRNDVFLWDSDQENGTFLDIATKNSPGVMEFPEDRPSQRMN